MLHAFSTLRIWGSALALLALTPAAAAAQGAPPAAVASNQTIAREKAESGLKLFGADRFEEAYKLFEEANKLYPAPTLLLYMARCQRKRGLLLEARALYEQLLAQPLPDDASSAFREAQADGKTELEALKQRIPSLQVTIAGAPATSARVLLEGVPLAPSARKTLNPGRYTLVATAEGMEPIERSVDLAEGSAEVVAITLRPRPASGGSLAPALAAFGVGVAGLGAGAVTGALVIGRANDLKSRCDGNLCPAADKDEADAARALGTVSTVAFVVGAAGVSAGVVLLLLRGGGGSGAPAAPAAVGARVGLGQVTVEGTF